MNATEKENVRVLSDALVKAAAGGTVHAVSVVLASASSASTVAVDAKETRVDFSTALACKNIACSGGDRFFARLLCLFEASTGLEASSTEGKKLYKAVLASLTTELRCSMGVVDGTAFEDGDRRLSKLGCEMQSGVRAFLDWFAAHYATEARSLHTVDLHLFLF